MHQATMTQLGFDQILEQLASFAACDLGKELAESIRPLTTMKGIQSAQDRY